MAETDCRHSVVIRWRTRIGSEVLGPTLRRAYPAMEASGFKDALRAIDQAESISRCGRDPPDPIPEY